MSKAYDIITDRIITELEKGVVPWRKPWNTAGMSKNLISGKTYQGVNAIMTNLQSFNSEYWLTFKQCQKLKGKIAKGSKATPIIFWKFLDGKVNEETGKADKIPMLKYSNVFNVCQTEGIDYPKPQTNTTEFTQIASAEKILEELPLGMPKVFHEEQRAYYSPGQDIINMPKKESFAKTPEYYSTLFHELTHSTGHKDRLNRDGVAGEISFGPNCYSKEELIAEIGASFLNGESGIMHKTIDNSTAYIKSWLSKLKGDKKLLITASGKAQKAVNYIRNITYDNK